MKKLRLVSDNLFIPFMRWRSFYFAGFAVLLVVTILFVSFRGLNLGISFTGGLSVNLRFHQPIPIAKLRSLVGNLQNYSLQSLVGTNDRQYILRVGIQGRNSNQITASLHKTLDRYATFEDVQYVGPSVGKIMRKSAAWSFVLAMLVIFIYLWFRFEWQFALVGVLALLVDVITTIGFFSALQLEFSTTTFAAILTIAGYSINDTVVVFDHVRESMRRNVRSSFTTILDKAVNATLSRTLGTSVTTLLVLIALILLGGPVIRDFIAALLWGVVEGTFSSVLFAVPLLFYIRPNAEKLLALDRAGQEVS